MLTDSPTAEPCNIGQRPTEREIYPHTLSKNDQRILFEGIKKERPELAGIMAQDKFVQALKNQFGGVFVLKESEYQQCYQAGLEIIEGRANENCKL